MTNQIITLMKRQRSILDTAIQTMEQLHRSEEMDSASLAAESEIVDGRAQVQAVSPREDLNVPEHSNSTKNPARQVTAATRRKIARSMKRKWDERKSGQSASR